MHRRIGGYEVLHALGQGAAAVVYLVREVESGERYALKLLHPDEAEKPSMQRRFVREAVVLRELNHPNIVRFIDCGLDTDQLYFVMELVECGSLKSALKNYGKLPWRTAVKIAGQVSEGLAHAHRHGVIHRDLKPANIFLATDGRVKIGDFGLAQDSNRHRLTVQAAAVGTCRYMAPEQIRCEDPLSGSVDIYSLGTVIYQMIVGRPMFDGKTHGEVFEAHLMKPAPVLGEDAPDCPPALSALVGRMVAKTAADRPEDADAVASELLTIMQQAPGAAGKSASPDQKTKLAEQRETMEDISIELLSGSTESASTADDGAA